MYCGKCGAPNPPTGQFCAHCGAALLKAAVRPPTPATAPRPKERSRGKGLLKVAAIGFGGFLLLSAVGNAVSNSATPAPSAAAAPVAPRIARTVVPTVALIAAPIPRPLSAHQRVVATRTARHISVVATATARREADAQAARSRAQAAQARVQAAAAKAAAKASAQATQTAQTTQQTIDFKGFYAHLIGDQQNCADASKTAASSIQAAANGGDSVTAYQDASTAHDVCEQANGTIAIESIPGSLSSAHMDDTQNALSAWADDEGHAWGAAMKVLNDPTDVADAAEVRNQLSAAQGASDAAAIPLAGEAVTLNVNLKDIAPIIPQQ